MSKEEVLVAIRDCAEKIGHPPSLTELRINTGVLERHVRKHFLTYKRALAECGMVREGCGYMVTPEALFKDWAELVRSMGKIPNINEYDMYSKYSHRPLVRRFGNWRQAQAGLLTLAEENGWEVQWKDVVDVLRAHVREAGMPVRTCKRQRSTPAGTGTLPRPTNLWASGASDAAGAWASERNGRGVYLWVPCTEAGICCDADPT